MNKYEEAQLALIENILPNIQEFIDKNIVGDKTMTASLIGEQFLKTNKAKITIDDFVKSFRLAVREGKLNGIEGAQRAGYRRIGAAKTNSADVILNTFKPYLEQVQAIIDKHIRGRNKMTAQAIYQKFIQENGGCKLNEEDFIKAFRLSLSKRSLIGIAGAGPYGYKHIDASDENEEENEEEPADPVQEIGASGCEISIDSTHKIVALDDRNWGYQIKKGATWTNAAYFCNCRTMLQSISRRMIDEHLKAMEGFGFNQLENKLDAVESNITKLLQKAIDESIARKREEAIANQE